MPSSPAFSQMPTASSKAVGLESVTSALHPERSFDAVAAHVNQVSADNPGSCLAARVDAQCGADLLLPAGLVNVAVQAEQRPHLLYRLQYARRADRAPHQVTCRGLEPQVLVEDRRGVQAGPVGRAVDEKDRSFGIFGLVSEGVDLLAEGIFGNLPRRLPWCRAGFSQPDDLQVTRDVHDRAVGVRAVLAGRERLVDVVRAVVARDA